tara:strand:- start:402 stop:668 length:267 start_codon:yes stop_codon:yes gene_type:complete
MRRGALPAQCLSDVHTGIVHYDDLVSKVYDKLFEKGQAANDENLRGVFVMFENQEIPVMSLDQLEIVLKMIAVSLSNNFLNRHSVSTL